VGRLDGNSGDAESVAASSPQSAHVLAPARARHAPALERTLRERLFSGLRKDRPAKGAGLRRG